jgi:hypothetical protein
MKTKKARLHAPKGKARVFRSLDGKFSVRASEPTGRPKLKLREINGTILVEAARALARPGIPRGAVFTTTAVNSYYVDPADPARMVRESSSGRRTVGRFVAGKFRAERSR